MYDYDYPVKDIIDTNEKDEKGENLSIVIFEVGSHIVIPTKLTKYIDKNNSKVLYRTKYDTNSFVISDGVIIMSHPKYTLGLYGGGLEGDNKVRDLITEHKKFYSIRQCRKGLRFSSEER